MFAGETEHYSHDGAPAPLASSTLFDQDSASLAAENTPEPFTLNLEGEHIQEVNVSEEMEQSFLEYAYSVIYSRALPDARDGLKPVQRRILYTMDQMRLSSTKGHVKSGRIVGEVMGKFHPHGDRSIYDALVRMAQPFTMRLPLVDGHGNFGSPDDGPAAYRYTEARPAPAADLLTASLHEDVVDFVPNYDNQLLQPQVLPAAFPNLLVNGASGIAVGMATNMAPHNLFETISAAKHLLQHPETSVEELTNFIPGPDLPTGGIIVGREGILNAYRSGKGSFRIRAKASIEKVRKQKTGVVVTELPYLVGPERVIERLKQAVEAKKVTGVSEVTDLSDRKHGLRLVITLKTGHDPHSVLEDLYAHTPLEDTFSINAVALVGGQPKTLGLKEILQIFLDHKIELVLRRSRFRLQQHQQRLHLVEGILIALADIDEVIQVIRTSENAETARQRLMTVFDLSERQAEYLLELRLRRLTKFSRIELEQERSELEGNIEELRRVLEEESALHELVLQELDEVALKHGNARRTLITEEAGQQRRARARAGAKNTGAAVQNGELALGDAAFFAPAQGGDAGAEKATVLLSTTGRLVQVRAELETLQATLSVLPHSAVHSFAYSGDCPEIGVAFSDGSMRKLPLTLLPAVPQGGIAFSVGVETHQLFPDLQAEVKAVGLCSLAPEQQQKPLALVTAGGTVKRLSNISRGTHSSFSLISLQEGDRVIAVCPAPETSDIICVSRSGQLARFSASTVRIQGLSAQGVIGMKLRKGDGLMFATAIEAGAQFAANVVTVASSSAQLATVGSTSLKLTALAQFPRKGRATCGVRAHRFTKGEDQLCAAWVGTGQPRALTFTGEPVRISSDFADRDARGSVSEQPVFTVGAAI